MEAARVNRRLLIAITLASVMLGGLLFVPLPAALRSPFGASCLNALHYPVFGIFTVAGRLMLLAFTRLTPNRANALALAAVIVAAFAVEIVQPRFGRGGSLEDALIGSAGAIVAALIPVLTRTRRRSVLWLLLLILGAAVVTRPAWRELLAIQHRDAVFPNLGRFESEAELSYWIPAGYLDHRPELVSRSTNHVSEGGNSLRVNCTRGKWPGVFMTLGGQDWRGYDALAFDLYNPGKTFELGLRLDDDHRDSEFWGYRYDGLFQPTNGWNHFEIPMKTIEAGGWRRGMNLAAIHRMILFVDWKQKPCEWYLDNVRLIKR